MRRIMIVTPDIVGPVKNGGIGTACFHWARTLAKAGHAVDILFAGPMLSDEDLAWWRGWYAELGIGFFAINDVPKTPVFVHGFRWYNTRSWRIMSWLRGRARYDEIIFQDWHANGFWTLRAKQMGLDFAETRLSVVAHSPTEWQHAGMRRFGQDIIHQADLEWCERESIAAADVLICPSRHMAGWLEANGYTLPKQVEVRPYTFEDEPSGRPPGAIDRDHLIFFGRLETRKGLHLLGAALRARKAAGERLPRKLSFLGKHATVEDEPSGDYLRRLSDDLAGVEIFVETEFDHREAVAYLRRENGVVVLPSILDNLPLTVIECVVNELAFIAAAAGGIPEMAAPGALFEPNAEALARKLAELPRLDFSSMRHPYGAEAAASSWLEHVGAAPPKTPTRRPTAAEGALPPISVCIPFHRHGRYLPRLLRAFLAMETPELQLVIVDDGTPAGELAELDDVRAELTAAGHVVHSQPNAGPGAARNKAAELAAHDLLLFFDADNVPFPDLVPRLWTAMRRTDADSVCAPYCAVPPSTRMPERDEEIWRFHPAGGSLVMGLFANTLGDTTALIRRDAVEAVGGFPTGRPHEGWEDWEFFYRLVGAGFRHYVFPEPLVFYTHHPDRARPASQIYGMQRRLFSQLDRIDPPVLAEITKTLAAHALVERGEAPW